MSRHCTARNSCCLLDALERMFSGCCCYCEDSQGGQKKKKKASKGRLCLAHGRHEVKISLNHEPHEVFVALKSGNCQVCQGDVDLVGTKLLPDGFVLYADIKSAECSVKWTAR